MKLTRKERREDTLCRYSRRLLSLLFPWVAFQIFTSLSSISRRLVFGAPHEIGDVRMERWKRERPIETKMPSLEAFFFLFFLLFFFFPKKLASSVTCKNSSQHIFNPRWSSTRLWKCRSQFKSSFLAVFSCVSIDRGWNMRVIRILHNVAYLLFLFLKK